MERGLEHFLGISGRVCSPRVSQKFDQNNLYLSFSPSLLAISHLAFKPSQVSIFKNTFLIPHMPALATVPSLTSVHNQTSSKGLLHLLSQFPHLPFIPFLFCLNISP